MPRIVQHTIGEVDIATFFAPKSAASVDQLVERLTLDLEVPPKWRFLKVWFKKFLVWEDFNA